MRLDLIIASAKEGNPEAQARDFGRTVVGTARHSRFTPMDDLAHRSGPTSATRMKGRSRAESSPSRAITATPGGTPTSRSGPIK